MESEELKLLGKLDGQVGMILPRLTELNTSIGNLFKNVDELKMAVGKFPCEDEGRRLDQAERDIQNLQGCISNEGLTVRTEKLKGTISLKNAVIGGVILVLATGIIETIINLIFTGKP